MAAITAVAAVIIPLFAPGRDGRRLRAVQLLTDQRKSRHNESRSR
jgi:hypothetical protein